MFGSSAVMTELTLPECLSRIGQRGLGRLAFDDGEGPTIVPVNYTFHAGVLHVRTADGGKLDAADRRERAAFEIDAVDLVHGRGWSVVVRGRLRRLVAPESAGYPGEPEPLIEGDRSSLIGLVPRSITGRILSPTGTHHVGVHPRDNTWLGRDGDDLLG